MKTWLAVLLVTVGGVILASCGGGSGGKRAPTSSSMGVVSIQVDSSCPDQSIRADGNPIGHVASGTTGSFEMPPGQHVIEACDSVYDCYTDVVVVEAGMEITYMVTCTRVGALGGLMEEVRLKHMLAE